MESILQSTDVEGHNVVSIMHLKWRNRASKQAFLQSNNKSFASLGLFS